jgi:hypothetical protein
MYLIDYNKGYPVKPELNRAIQLLEKESLPNRWQGMDIQWDRAEPIPLVYIAEFNNESSDLYLFGKRYKMSRSKDLSQYGEGYFIEFFLVELSNDGIIKLHRLLQQHSVVYSDTEEKKDYKTGRRKDFGNYPYKNCLPKWIEKQVNWPTFTGLPMTFVGQVNLPKNEVTEKFFTWDSEVFLFETKDSNGMAKYKIIKQNLL